MTRESDDLSRRRGKRSELSQRPELKTMKKNSGATDVKSISIGR